MKTIQLNHGYSVQVDDEDYDKLIQFNWWVHNLRENRNTCYAAGKPDGSFALMHRFIMGASTNDPEVDHKDENGLNNQKANLRFATDSQQRQNTSLRVDNTSGFKGVYPSESGKWRAECVANGLRSYAGTLETPEAAARAYDAHASILHGEFANMNFPEDVGKLAELPLPDLPNRDKTQCPQGHPYEVGNIDWHRNTETGNMDRSCSVCRRDKANTKYHTERAEFLANGGVSNACADRPNCKYGHPYEGENLIIKTNKKTGKTQRVCRICKNAGLKVQNDKRQAKKVAARKGEQS